MSSPEQAVPSPLLSRRARPSEGWSRSIPPVLGDGARARRWSTDVAAAAACALRTVASQVGANKDSREPVRCEKTGPVAYHCPEPARYAAVARMPTSPLGGGSERRHRLSYPREKQTGADDLERGSDRPRRGPRSGPQVRCADATTSPAWRASRGGASSRPRRDKGGALLRRPHRHTESGRLDLPKLSPQDLPPSGRAVLRSSTSPRTTSGARAFLTSGPRASPARYRTSRPGRNACSRRLLVARYNERCHVIEGAGGNIRRLYEEQPSREPPITDEGRRCRATGCVAS